MLLMISEYFWSKEGKVLNFQKMLAQIICTKGQKTNGAKCETPKEKRGLQEKNIFAILQLSQELQILINGFNCI